MAPPSVAAALQPPAHRSLVGQTIPHDSPKGLSLPLQTNLSIRIMKYISRGKSANSPRFSCFKFYNVWVSPVRARGGLSVKPENLLGGAIIVFISDCRDKRLAINECQFAHTRTEWQCCWVATNKNEVFALISIWVGQLFWHGASTHLKQRCARHRWQLQEHVCSHTSDWMTRQF